MLCAHFTANPAWSQCLVISILQREGMGLYANYADFHEFFPTAIPILFVKISVIRVKAFPFPPVAPLFTRQTAGRRAKGSFQF